MRGGPCGFGYDLILFGIGYLSLLAYALIEVGAGLRQPRSLQAASERRLFGITL
jgi:hypothetical protein